MHSHTFCRFPTQSVRNRVNTWNTWNVSCKLSKRSLTKTSFNNVPFALHPAELAAGPLPAQTPGNTSDAPSSDAAPIFLDTRDLESFEKEHIAFAAHMPDLPFYTLPSSNAADIASMQRHFVDQLAGNGITGREGEHVVVYEQGAQPEWPLIASCRAWYLLKYLGHPSVSVLRGGLDAYKAHHACRPECLARGAMEREAVALDEFVARVDASLMCDKEELLAALQRRSQGHGVTVLDVRDQDEWYGFRTMPPISQLPSRGLRKGRVPNSTWIEWYRFMDLEDRGNIWLKDGEAVEQLMEAHAGVVDKEQEIIVYCFIGARASNVVMALKQAGFANVKNYVASWKEWGRDWTLPIDDRALTK